MMENIFGENLRRIRQEKNVSQSQLSKILGVCKPNISKWENGKAYPQVIWVYKIATALDVEPEKLIGVAK